MEDRDKKIEKRNNREMKRQRQREIKREIESGREGKERYIGREGTGIEYIS